MQHQQHDVVARWRIGRKLYSTPCVPLHVLSPCAPAALLQLCASLQDSAEHMLGHNQEIQEWEKVFKGRGRWEASVSTLLHLFVKHRLLSSCDSA